MKICHPKECTGCGVCELVCPTKAISMQEDREGFLAPYIDNDRCCNCLRCKKSCHVLKNNLQTRDTPELQIWAYFIFNDLIRKTSASGGAFWSLAQRWIKAGGVVVGAAYEPFPEVKHIIVSCVSGLAKLQGSKYVYSDVRHSFMQIKKLLNSGSKVMFSGLPCQVAALKEYVGDVELRNLFTVDLICHGIPPLKLFKRYLRYYEETNNLKLTDYKFRTKKGCDWNDSTTYQGEHIGTSGSVTNVPLKRNWYMRYFLGATSFRNACYKCKYACLLRAGDITLGDFWGIEKQESFGNSFKEGVSLVLANSKRGQELISEWKTFCDGLFQKMPLTCATRSNGQLSFPSKRNIYRNFIFSFIYLRSNIALIGFDKLLFTCGRIASFFGRRGLE